MRTILKIAMACAICVIGNTDTLASGPGDPSIEALIALHKTLYNGMMESAKMEQTQILPINAINKEQSGECRDYREIVNNRLKDMGDWAGLGVSVATVSLDVVNLVKEYTQFTKEAIPLIRANPTAAWHYYKAEKAIFSLIKRAQKLASVTAVLNTGVMRATLEQKHAAIYEIQGLVDQIRYQMSRTLFTCRWVLGCRTTFMNIYDIVSDDEMKRAAANVISKWQK